MARAAGQVLGDRYRLVQQVGKGSVGEVWRGHDEVLDREVAVKEIRPVLFPGLPASVPDELIALIVHEAGALARLDHPGIAATYDAVWSDGTPWIVRELISGLSLAQVIDAHGPLAWQRTAALGADLAEALAYAHAAGVIHTRLSPNNVLLAEGRTVLTDFALTDFIMHYVIGDRDWMPDSGVKDAWRYLAPEQVLGQLVQAPADMWALGATLYAAVEGCPPFAGETAQVLFGICYQPIPAPRHAGPTASILNSLMTRGPGQRPTASAAAELLQAVAAKETGPALRRPGTANFWASCLLRARQSGAGSNCGQLDPQNADQPAASGSHAL
jgi:serine/threonine protein kinase